jgi:S-adenosylmethionine hydrolase
MARTVSLITDFGYRDFYAGALKGAILKACGDVHLVDISHGIARGNLTEAAFTLRSAYYHFPKGTVHIVSVNDEADEYARFAALQHRDHFFLGADTGLFSLAFDTEPELAFEPTLVQEQRAGNITGSELYAKLCAFILSGKPLREIGRPIQEIRRVTPLAPQVQPASIKGAVQYVDSFHNVVTNISRELFEQVRNGRSFIIQFRRERVQEISRFYYEVPPGEKLCLFNTAGFLEIAMNQGPAASMLGLGKGDQILIEFV